MTDFKNSSSTDYSASSTRLATPSNVPVVGLDDYVLAMKERLCGEPSSLQVIPIVGMGGIGKTTLARITYKDSLIMEHFDIRAWVTVSQDYSALEVLSALLVSMKVGVDKSGDGSIQLMAVKAYKKLKGRRYLIVVDDIWRPRVWDDLKKLFPDDANGSRIILTTRKLDVATYASDCVPHEMKLMNKDESWDLLRQVAMEGVCDTKLEDVGKAIARGCRGLPLAILVVAGLLSTVERSRASWEEIKEKVNSTVAAKDGQFEKILSLSYMDLPPNLRQCFVYLGGFPEDREIPVAKLIKLWAAEGFLGASIVSGSLEEEAEECLNDLIRRSLVFVVTRNPRGKIKSCSLHDLMRDLCRRKADEDRYPLYDVNVHKTLVRSFREGTLEDVKDLRVIDWDPAGKEFYLLIRDQIFWLSSLRYLVLDCLVELPPAVSKLENLQTLIIYALGGWVRLPREIWRMQQLRHLVSSFDQLPCPQGAPLTCFTLGNLHTLSKLLNLECSHGFVKMVPNMKKLGLVYSATYDCVEHHHLSDLLFQHQLPHPYDQAHDYDFRLENLRWLHQLEKLKLQVYPGFRGRLNPTFPQSLKSLSLWRWILTSWSDMSVVGSLPNLQVLKLRDFGGQDEKWETTEGEFASLTFLLFERCNLQEWITESEHFPRLKWLRIYQCRQLSKIPTDIGEIPTLELIEVKDCRKAVYEWARQIVEEQQEMGNDSLQVRGI